MHQLILKKIEHAKILRFRNDFPKVYFNLMSFSMFAVKTTSQNCFLFNILVFCVYPYKDYFIILTK